MSLAVAPRRGRSGRRSQCGSTAAASQHRRCGGWNGMKRCSHQFARCAAVFTGSVRLLLRHEAVARSNLQRAGHCRKCRTWSYCVWPKLSGHRMVTNSDDMPRRSRRTSCRRDNWLWPWLTGLSDGFLVTGKHPQQAEPRIALRWNATPRGPALSKEFHPCESNWDLSYQRWW